MADQQINGPTVSEVSICNQALTWLGQDIITSLDDQSVTAQWCRNNYPFIRDAVLQERNWTFATIRAVSETAEKDDWETQWKHSIPPQLISVFRVYRTVRFNGDKTRDPSWRREGEFILSDQSTIYLWGLGRLTDTSQMSPLFTQALATRIAAEGAVPFTENRQLQTDLWALYGDKLREAAARDGQQGANEFVTQTQLVDSRYGGRAF